MFNSEKMFFIQTESSFNPGDGKDAALFEKGETIETI
jgi:hypothetical protein